MTGPEAGSRVDTGAVDGFLATAAAVRDELEPGIGRMDVLDEHVRMGCGPWSPAGGALGGLRRLLTGLADHELDVGRAMMDLRSVDSWSEGAPGRGPSSTRASFGSPIRATARLGHGVAASATAGRVNPWIDPTTDSWVVNLVRLGGGLPPSPAFAERGWLAAPGLARLSIRTSAELSLEHQLVLAATDPRQFATNLFHLGQGALEAGAGLARAAAGVGVLVTPGLDQVYGRVLGREPGRELLAGLAETARLVLVDPDGFGRSQIGWSQLQDDPYRWLGQFAPDLALQLGGGALFGRGSRLTRSARSATALAEPTEAMRSVQRLADAVAPTEQRVLSEAVRRDVTVLDDGALSRSRDLHRPLDVPSPDTGPGLPDLAEFRRGEPDWADAGPVVSHRLRPFEPPETWVAHINGEGMGGSRARQVNCIDCARAVEANWRGHDAVAAPLRNPARGGTSAALLENWSGGQLVATSIEEIGERLTELGPGSSAMVVTTWRGPGAHAFNAVNDRGIVTWIDAQSGHVGPWPPPYAERVDTSSALFIDANGVPG